MKSKESKNILWTSSFFIEPISFLAFSTVRRYITHFYNKEYIIISSLTSGATDMGKCFFKRRSIKIIRLKKEIVLSVFHYFFDLSIYIGGSSNQLMGILLCLFFYFSVKSFCLFSPRIIFPWCDLFPFAVSLTLWNVIMDKKFIVHHKLIYSQKYFFQKNENFITSNIESNIAYYYTLYTSVYV